MARIAGVNIPNHQHAVIALTAIYGIGRTRAQKICATAGIITSTKIKDLSDSEMEKLRDAWFAAPDLATQKKLAEQMQLRAWETVPYIPTAMFIIPTAYRSSLTGILVSPMNLMWNVGKK